MLGRQTMTKRRVGRRSISLPFFVVLAMLIAMSIPCVAFADDGFELSDDGKTLIEYNGNAETVIIPDGVETIGHAAFYGNSNIKKLVMPDSLTKIDDQAFRFCDEITEIQWSQNLKTIDFSAFEGVRSVSYIELPDSLEHLDDYAFRSCDKLEYIRLPERLQYIGSKSFCDDPMLRAITIPDSVTHIGRECFTNNYEIFTLVAGADSAAERYAEKNSIPYSTAGTNVDYTAQVKGSGTFSVQCNGSALSSPASVQVGDVLDITAKTSAPDVNVVVNGKSINYFYEQETKAELVNYPFIVTGPIELECRFLTKGKTLNESLNVEGGTLKFTGANTTNDVDEGRRIATFTDYEDGYIRTTVNPTETAYLLFDMKLFAADYTYENIILTIDDDEYVFDMDWAGSWYRTQMYELTPGKHVITWSGCEGYDEEGGWVRFGLSEVMVTSDLSQVRAKAFSVPYSQIDLDIGESLALEYDLKPDLLSGKKSVSWSSSNETVASVENGTVTGVAKGKCKITGTIDGIKRTVMVYVTGKNFGDEPVEQDPEYPESELITDRTALPADVTNLYTRFQEIHVKGDKDAYVYDGNKLYRMTLINTDAHAQELLSVDDTILSAKARGKMIYLMSAPSYSSETCTISGYDTTSGSVVYEQTFNTGSDRGAKFAVDDDENMYFVLKDKDIYSYDRNGTLISQDVQSDSKLISGMGDVILDQVDPFNYTLLATFADTMGRALTTYDNSFSYSGFGDVFAFLYNTTDFAGMRRIRGGEIIGSESYVKDPDVAAGSYWTFLDKGNYAVNANGIVAKFHKNKKTKPGIDFDVLVRIPDMKGLSYYPAPAAVYAGGSIYVANSKNIVYKVDSASGKIQGTFDLGDADVQNLYAANGHVYYVAEDPNDGWFAEPLEKVSFEAVRTITRSDHVTLTYEADQVKDAYNDSLSKIDYSKADNVYSVKPSWKAPYKAGALKEAVQQETLGRLNYARWQYGINPVSLNDAYMERNQKGAVVMAATDELTHYPEQPADMDDDFFAEAKKGVGAEDDYSGNCSQGDSIFDSIKGYLDDTQNLYFDDIGHRLSLLDENADKTSFGSAGAYSCLSMYYAEDPSALGNDEAFYAWPSAGYFPLNMIDANALWHVKTDWHYAPNEEVHLTYKGTTYKATKLLYEGFYNTFYFALPTELKEKVINDDNVYKDGTEIQVTLSGLQDKMGNDIVVTYPVRLIDCHVHRMVHYNAKAPTCTAAGYEAYDACSDCGYKEGYVKLPALGHKWKHYKKAAGLLKNGTEYDYCTVCKTKKNVKTLKGYATYYVKGFKLAPAKAAFTAKWTKQSTKNQKKFNGYQIRYSTKSNMAGAKYATAGKASKSKKITKLKKKTKYYVQVRTYTISKKVKYYSKWSAKKAVKTK